VHQASSKVTTSESLTRGRPCCRTSPARSSSPSPL
jgi:hypothetical protein